MPNFIGLSGTVCYAMHRLSLEHDIHKAYEAQVYQMQVVPHPDIYEKNGNIFLKAKPGDFVSLIESIFFPCLNDDN